VGKIPVESPVRAFSDPRYLVFHGAVSIAKSRSGEKYTSNNWWRFGFGFVEGTPALKAVYPSR
jgi:hypothetical protein